MEIFSAVEMHQVLHRGGNAEVEASPLLQQVSRILFAQNQANQAAKSKPDGTNTTTSEDKIKPYTQYEMAALYGFIGSTNREDIPDIWKLFKTSKEIEDHRLNIAREMRKWSKSMGIEIDRTMFLPKDVIDDLVKLRFNPVGVHVSLKSCDKGISNMLAVARTVHEVEAMRIFEENVAATTATRTLKELEKMANSEKKHPPTEYHSLKLMIATYAALLFVLFGQYCELYKKVLAMYQILDMEEVMVVKAAFSPLKCKQITWALYHESRMFFNNRLSPVEFDPATPILFATANLDDVIWKMRQQEFIHRSTYPFEWMDVPQHVPPPPATPSVASAMGFLSPYTVVYLDLTESHLLLLHHQHQRLALASERVSKLHRRQFPVHRCGTLTPRICTCLASWRTAILECKTS